MTCADVAQLLDAFLDAELPAPMLLEVARHAAACPACDAAARDLTTLHEAVERSVRGAADTLDLSGVWPAVAGAADRVEARRAWGRRLRATPLWGAGLAAAGLLVWLNAAPRPEPSRLVAAERRPNHAIIERIDSDAARLELRRERKYGTTLIMVSADGETVP